MIAKFLEGTDPRLEQVSDFEVQTIAEDGEIINIDWHGNSTFDEVFDKIGEKHRKGLEISVLDYGDKVQAVAMANAKSIKHHYVVIMIDFYEGDERE